MRGRHLAVSAAGLRNQSMERGSCGPSSQRLRAQGLFGLTTSPQLGQHLRQFALEGGARQPVRHITRADRCRRGRAAACWRRPSVGSSSQAPSFALKSPLTWRKVMLRSATRSARNAQLRRGAYQPKSISCSTSSQLSSAAAVAHAADAQVRHVLQRVRAADHHLEHHVGRRVDAAPRRAPCRAAARNRGWRGSRSGGRRPAGLSAGVSAKSAARAPQWRRPSPRPSGNRHPLPRRSHE